MEDQPQQRQIKYCESICESILKFVNEQMSLGIPKSPLEWASDVESPWTCSFGGISIIANHDFSEFEVGYEVYDGGSYWEPPSSDYVVYSTKKTCREAMWDVVNLWVQNNFQTWCESQVMEDISSDYSDYSEDEDFG